MTQSTLQNGSAAKGEKPIAALCLLPDPGHVLQLLRLSAEISRRLERRVVFFAPESGARLAQNYAVEFRTLPGINNREAAPVLAALSRRSRFRVGFSSDRLLAQKYWASLMEPVDRALPELLVQLATLNPELLICDGHVFKPVYLAIARRLDIPIAFSRAGGTLIGQRSRYEQVYGLSTRPALMKRFVEFLGWRYNQAGRMWMSLTDRAGAQRFEAGQNGAQALARRHFETIATSAPTLPFEIFAGLAASEVELPAAGELPRQYVILPPIIDEPPGLAAGPEQAWLDQDSEKPVVLISFGTMVQPSNALLEAIARGALQAGARVLLSSPRQPEGLISTTPQADLFQARFVPQLALLGSGRIAAFIGHGGPGGLCEAIACGVPCLSIPFIWDQSYAASIADALGASLTVPRRGATPDSVAPAVRRLLHETRFRESAQALAARWRETLRSNASWTWLTELGL